MHKVRCLEKDGKAKAERIQQLQEKNMQAVVQTPGYSVSQHLDNKFIYAHTLSFIQSTFPGGKKRSIPFRRQRMQIDELVPPSSTSAYPVLQPDDPYVADLLQLADGRFALFRQNVKSVMYV